MLSPRAVRCLSISQREMLIAHIDVPVDIDVSEYANFPVRRSLFKMKLLQPHPIGAIRPRQTALTTAGRHAVAVILADYADALVRAGLLEQEQPMRALQALQGMKLAGFADNPPPRPRGGRKPATEINRPTAK